MRQVARRGGRRAQTQPAPRRGNQGLPERTQCQLDTPGRVALALFAPEAVPGMSANRSGLPPQKLWENTMAVAMRLHVHAILNQGTHAAPV